MSFLKHRLQNWWCQQVADQDPDDNETLFPFYNQPDEEPNRQLDLFKDLP